jgi:glycosyltransferase involved in cell wall biosynthesis
MHLSDKSKRHRILFVVDCPGWAHDYKTASITRVLETQFEFRRVYQDDLIEEDLDSADLIVIYYWLQIPHLRHLRRCLKKHRHKVLIGICSHWEIEGSRRRGAIRTIRDYASAIFVNNQLLFERTRPLFDATIFLRPNGVDVDFFMPGPSRSASEILRVGWAGRFDKFEEGYDGYRDFIVPAVKHARGWELVTAMREEVWRSREEMRRFYRSLDGYICASLGEGTPNPCLEAAACGVPLLTTPVGNMPELVRDGVNGYFIQRDQSDIVAKLKLLQDEQTRKEFSRRMIIDIQRWDWKRRAQAYREMFEKTLSYPRL